MRTTDTGHLKTGLLAALALCLGLFCGGVQAQTLAALPSASAGLTTGGEARPILAWTEFCQSYPAECAFDTVTVARKRG